MSEGSTAEAVVNAMPGSQLRAWRAFMQAVAHQPALKRPTQREQSGGPLARVIALGGSMLGGAECNDGVAEAWSAACAYPRRFVDALETGGSGAIDFVSMATGGTTSISVLPSLPSLLSTTADMEGGTSTPTLIIIDYSVNDALEVRRNFQAAISCTQH